MVFADSGFAAESLEKLPQGAQLLQSGEEHRGA
jgi:hypothetical protein